MAEPWREPFASSERARRRMVRQRRRDTEPELALRRALHRRGLRYFVHRRPLAGLHREADVVFPGARVAVFVDGCFWHGCPDHSRKALTNAWYWPDKIERNRARDADTSAQLVQAGWLPVRIWEPEESAKRIEAAVALRRTCAPQDSAGPDGRSDCLTPLP